MVQRRQLRLMGMDKRWILIWIFYRNQQIIFLIIKILIQILFLLQLSWRPWILKVQYSYQLIFWFCLSINQRFLFQWYNVLWRSCWQHLLFLRSIILGGIIICKFQFWLHRWQLVLNQGRLILGRVFQLQFLRRKCWKHHLLLQWSYQMAFVHLVEFHVLNRTIPSKHYRLRYQLIQHEY